MDAIFNQRIARIIAHREQAQASRSRDEGQLERQRREARDRVVNELPHVAAKITRTVEELNDLLSDNSIVLSVTSAAHQTAVEALYTISVADRFQDGPSLRLSVDYHGTVCALISYTQNQSLLAKTTVFDMDREWLMNLLLSLLETYYP